LRGIFFYHNQTHLSFQTNMVNAKLIAVVLVAGVGISTFVALSTTYHSNSDALSADSTVGEVCAMMDPDNMTPEVSKLCEDGNDVPLFETLGCGSEGNDVATFTMGEIITAEDVQAAFSAVFERCTGEARRLGDGEEGHGRKLVVDYGWCSMNAGFILGGSDSANYCDDGQRCDSYGGCGGAVSSCCIEHDKCLQSDKAFGRCSKTNTAGQCCDKKLAQCAGRQCRRCDYKCGWFRCIDFGCLVDSGVACLISGVMGAGSHSPQAEWNTGGSRC